MLSALPSGKRPARPLSPGSGTGPLHGQTGHSAGSSTDVAALQVPAANVTSARSGLHKGRTGRPPSQGGTDDHTYPTIQELDRKSVRELHAIFRQAADVSTNAQRDEAERAAARQEQDNIRRVLAVRSPRP